MAQMSTWLTDNDVQRLVVVVSGIDSGETLERWQFNVSVDEKEVVVGIDENVSHNVVKTGGGEKKGKTVKEVHDEIQAIIRQITASVSDFWLCYNPSYNKRCQLLILFVFELNCISGDLFASAQWALLFRSIDLHKQNCRGSKEVGRFRSSIHYEQPGGQVA